MLGAGIVAWFILPLREYWISVILAGFAIGFTGLSLSPRSRLARVLIWSGGLIAFGCALAWWRADDPGRRILSKPVTTAFEARVIKLHLRPAEDKVRLLLAPASEELPAIIRVTLAEDAMIEGIGVDAVIRLRARLMPPGDAPVPGAYDFARAAWFQHLGATGRVLGPIAIVSPTPRQDGFRERLTAHVRSRLDGSAGGIAAAFATGDRGGIDPADEEAMRASGLTHLLSISGLHITAVVGATMWLTLRVLAVSGWLALRVRLPIIAALAGALAGIGYTILTGAEVPTIRSCIAAVLVLGGLALGREAITLRLVATGALIVLLFIPEAVIGPSFQLSFAAITAIVALHELPWVRALTLAREEGIIAKTARVFASLLITGVAVELVLAPIAMFHFSKSGLYGALANIVAIPLTTFVIMPFQALAMLLDTIGLGAPMWWVTGMSLELLLWIARAVAATPGAMAALPTMPVGAFGAMLGGGLWLLLWSSRIRFIGAIPFLAGAAWALSARSADVFVTGDGRHMAIHDVQGSAILRERAGDYIRDVLNEQSGDLEPAVALDAWPNARCSRDLCLVTLAREGRTWSIAATRSGYRLPWAEITALCASTDIVVSDRRLPAGCTPRWLKLDSQMLGKSGGIAIHLAEQRVITVRAPADDHPWIVGPAPPVQYRRSNPANRP